MADVLLVYPSYSYPKKWPPIGLGYIASVLKVAGYSVDILDMSVLGMSHEDLENHIRQTKPKLVGISFMTNQFQEAVNVSKIVKDIDKNIPVIVGGPHVSALPEEILAHESVDIAVRGEGEVTILELANCFLGSEKFELSAINGIAYKKEGQVHLTQRRELIQDLDSIPSPAWHLLPIKKYSVPATGGDVKESVFAIISSRGCPNRCIFCDSHTVFGRKFRARSAQNIFDELVYLNKNFGATQFDFVDDTITVNKNRIYQLCDLILSSNNKFKWMCNARVNTVNEDLLKLMKSAGCVRVEFGVESGDPKVLKKIKKAVTIEQIKNAHAMARKAGLSIGSFVMVGNLGEDFSSVTKTKVLLEQIDTDDVFIAIATPFPGTELYEIAKNHSWLLSTDWSKYVTSPTHLPNYKPLMKTDKMSTREILKAFFYLHSRFVKKKLKTRYGSLFLLKKRFYKDHIFNVKSKEDFKYKLKLIKELLSSYFKRW